MCVSCLVTVQPDRGRTCLETGAYLLNYAGCTQCRSRAAVVLRHRKEQEEESDDGDYEQTITFARQQPHNLPPPLSRPQSSLFCLTHPLVCADHCGDCDHEIAGHYFTFSVSHPTRVPDAADAGAPLPSARVHHDYLMDCALCGKATDFSHTVNDVVANGGAQPQTLPLHHAPASHPPVHFVTSLVTLHAQSHIHAHVQGTADVADDEWD